MTTASRSPSRQGTLILAKINAVARKAAAQDQVLALAKAKLCEVFSSYFGERAANADLSQRLATASQLGTAPAMSGSWFVFDDQGDDIVIGVSDDLVLAAADFAICQKVSPGAGAKPTPIDRSIAAALASRLAGVMLVSPRLRGISDTVQHLALPSVPYGWTVFQFVGSIGSDNTLFAVTIARPVTAPDQKAAPSTTVEPVFSARARAISVSARCIVGAIETPLRRALDLKRGDILKLDWQGTHGLPLVAGGKTIAIGSLGEHNGRRAMKIADWSGGQQHIRANQRETG